MRLNLRLPALASLFMTACASVDSMSSAKDAGSRDAGSNDANAPQATGDGSALLLAPDADVFDAGAPDAACAAFPGCASGVSCPEGDGCHSCSCEEALWVCPMRSCSDAGAEAGSDAGVCPATLPDLGSTCATPDDLICLYGNACPINALRCESGAWQVINAGAGICPPPNP